MVHARQKCVDAKQDILMRDQKVIKRDKKGLFFFSPFIIVPVD